MRSESKLDREASPFERPRPWPQPRSRSRSRSLSLSLSRRQRRAASGGGLALLLAVTFLAFVNYAALLSVVPLWASTGGAASAAVGATTGAMMAATVATQLAMPWVFRILRLRDMMIVGAVLLSVPTPLYLLSAAIAPVMVITVVRGIGFAFVVMAGATLAADLAPEGRLARSVSLYGAAAALPNLAALAGGVWIAHAWGFQAVFWGSATVTLAGAGLAFLLPGQHRGHFSLTTPAGTTPAETTPARTTSPGTTPGERPRRVWPRSPPRWCCSC